jgi:lipoyl(octanoyl) transferase
VHAAAVTGEALWVCELGTVDYREALELQLRVRAARQADLVPDTLLLLEHPAVYTRGRRSVPGELPLGEDFYRARGIDIVDVDRGGKLTYHGPGQLVGYPIMRIVDVIDYLRTVERAIVATLADVAALDARARPDDGPDYTGVWTGARKVASIGVHVSRGVTTHGFAINVDNDLEPFSWVVPCGLDGVTMTSVAIEAGDARAPMPVVRASVAQRLAEAFGRRAIPVSPDALDAALAALHQPH